MVQFVGLEQILKEESLEAGYRLHPVAEDLLVEQIPIFSTIMADHLAAILN